MKKVYLLLFSIVTCFDAQCQLICDFEPSMNSEGWTTYSNHSGGFALEKQWEEQPDPWNPIFGDHSAFIDRENIGQGQTAEYWLISRQTLINADDVLTFRGSQTIAGDQGTTYEVRITNDSRTNWESYVTLASWGEDAFAVADSDTEKAVSLDTYDGDLVYIAFVKRHTQPFTAIFCDRWMIDNIKVDNSSLSTAVNTGQIVSVYPNPTQSHWNFNAGRKTIASIEIIDVLGKVVVTSNPNSEKAVIDAFHLGHGVYFAKLTTGATTEIVRLVKN